jgi:hypothetical protein
MITLQQSGYALGVAALGTLFIALSNDDPSPAFAVVIGIQTVVTLLIGAAAFLLPATASARQEDDVQLENLPLEV